MESIKKEKGLRSLCLVFSNKIQKLKCKEKLVKLTQSNKSIQSTNESNSSPKFELRNCRFLSKILIITLVGLLSYTDTLAKENKSSIFSTDLSTLTAMSSLEVSSDELNYFKRYEKERTSYISAINAYNKGEYDKVNTLLKTKLKDYPLASNLEYLLLRNSGAKLENVVKFIGENKYPSLSNALQNYYFYKFGKQQNYTKMFKVMPLEPKRQNSKCLWWRGKYETKAPEQEQALTFIKDLYISGDKLPEQCKEFANFLKDKNKITVQDTYERLRASFWTKSGSNIYKQAMQDLEKNKSSAKNYAQALTMFKKLYDKPQNYDRLIPPQMASVAVAAFKRYARTSPRDAINKLASFEKKYHPSEEELDSIKKVILQSVIYSRTTAPNLFIDQNLSKLGTPSLIEQRFRLAVWSKDYKGILKTIELMSEDAQKADNIRYWKARALENTGNKILASKIYNELAKERSFYGYVAADKLKVPYSINAEILKLPDEKQILNLMNKYPSYARFLEYHYLRDVNGIQSEWYDMMQLASFEDARTLAALVANKGYAELAVWQSIYKKDWDVLSLRFPIILNNLYETNSQQTGVSLSYLYGITRQESMMNVKAQSPVGARGLMQLMPQTAKDVNKNLKLNIFKTNNDLFNPEVNVTLGANYLKQLLNTFKGNRIYSTVGYNAGPHRSIAWQSKDGIKRDFITYVESIPFSETRNYVQKVLFYTYIYQVLLHDKKPVFLTEEERNSWY